MQLNFSWHKLPSGLVLLCQDAIDTFERWMLRVKLSGCLAHLGDETVVSPPFYMKHPHKIWIGDKVEVRSGCGFYARSKFSEGIRIGQRCRIKEYCILDSYGGSIVLGNQVLLGQGATIHGHGGVTIGDYSLIGAKTTIVSSNHKYRDVPIPIQEQGETLSQTTIGKNVWIGAHAVVLAGVTIHDNSVVAAGSVVHKDIPAYSVACGVPALVTKRLQKEREDS